MNEITEMMNNFGIPVTMLIVVGLYFLKINNRIMDESKLREERLIQERKESELRFFSQFEKYDQTMDKFNNTLIKIDNRISNIENKEVKHE